MARVIAVSNQKGGVGKTTTAVNLSAALAKMGKTICLIDMDPQGNAGRSFGLDVTGIENTTVEFLLGKLPLEEVRIIDANSGVSIIPSNLRLAGFDPRADGIDEPFMALKKHIEPYLSQYDYFILDCPPSLGLLNINALVAADSVIIPVQCEYFAMEAVAAILSSITQIQRSYNPNLRIEGLLLTMFDNRTKLAIDVMQEVKSFFKETTFASIVPRNVSVAKAVQRGEPVTSWRPNAMGSLAYFALAREVLEHEK